MQIGDQFIARLNLDREVLLVYTVRFCQRLENGHHRIGAQFCGLAATQFIGDPEQIVDALAVRRRIPSDKRSGNQAEADGGTRFVMAAV